MNVKKFFILLLVLIFAVTLAACDFGQEGESSAPKPEQSGDTSVEESTSRPDVSTYIGDNSDGEVSTDVTKEFTGVNVRLVGTDALEKSGFRTDDSFYAEVDVVLSGNAETLNDLLAEDISATVDVSIAKSAGEKEFDVEVDAPDSTAVVSVTPNTVKITIKKKSSSGSSTSTSDPEPSGDAYINKNGIIIVGDRGMEQYSGSASKGEDCAKKLNAFREKLDSNINMYVLAVPIASAYYAPDKYPKSITNHQKCFEALENALDGVKYVDVLNALSSRVDEPLYAKTDFHWNALGAYYAAEEFSKVAGTNFDKLNKFTEKSFDGYLGSLATRYATELKKYPETFIWYEPTSTYTVTYYSRDKFKNPKTGMGLFSSSKSYSKFIQGDSYTTVIKTNVGNGRKLLIFKESYGNALAPFLISQFDEIIIADYRYFSLNAIDFAKEQGVTDLCFELSAFGVAGNNRNFITKLMNY